MNFPSDPETEGIRVTMRLLITADAEQRFDANGNEILQLRGRVVDNSVNHPEVVVRFAGQRRAELYRWAKPDKHLSVDGTLEVKTWTAPSGKYRVALLVEARNMFPLNPADTDPGRAGIYQPRGRAGPPVKRRSKADAITQMRNLLDKDDV